MEKEKTKREREVRGGRWDAKKVKEKKTKQHNNQEEVG